MKRKPRITAKEVEEAVALLETQGIIEKDEAGVYKIRQRDIPSDNCIQLYFHCRQCIETMPPGMSPAEWRRISVGFTELGIQAWCDRHDCNIFHIDFEGQSHPANRGAKERQQ